MGSPNNFSVRFAIKKFRRKSAKIFLGDTFPYFSAIGNHDQPMWPTYAQIIYDRLTRFGAKCWGDVGRDCVCSYKGFVVAISGFGTSSSFDHTFLGQGTVQKK